MNKQPHIFFVGDFQSDNGPGVANRTLFSGFSHEQASYSEANGLVSRSIECFKKIKKADAVCICSFTAFDYLVIYMALFFHKKIFYIQHGFARYEESMNQMTDEKKLKSTIKLENFIFKHVDKVYCVSKNFMNYMKEALPEYVQKFDYHFNTIDFEHIEKYLFHNQTQHHSHVYKIISVGGGMKRKGNLEVCQAIQQCIEETNRKIEFYVVGPAYTEKEKICQYPFVHYIDSLPRSELIQLMAVCDLYVQNSFFETFGLAIIEGNVAGCDVLVSNQVGAKDVFDHLDDTHIIYDNKDIKEIAEKIAVLSQRNSVRAICQRDKLTPHYSAQQLYEKISKVLMIERRKI